jgi:hypothetical protein
MNDEKLTFANGTEVKGHGIETDSLLILYLFDTTMTEMFYLLNDPENVRTIWWERYSETGKWTGFQQLMSISIEAKGMICASIKRVVS